MKALKTIFFRTGQLACLLFFGVMLCSSSLVLHFAKEGLAAWAGSVLPLLLPFIILSKFWIYYGIPEMFFHAAQKIFHKNAFLAASLPIFVLGLCSGFPIGAVFLSFFYERGILEKKEAEELLPLASFVSPMFVMGYVRPLVDASGKEWGVCLFTLYAPVFLCFLHLSLKRKTAFHWKRLRTCASPKAYTSPKKKNERSYPPDSTEKKCTEKQAIRTQQNAARGVGVTAILTSSLEVILLIGAYMMLFSVLFGLLGCLKLVSLPGMPFLLANLEVTTGIRFLSEYYGNSGRLCEILLLAATASGGLCTMAQVQTIISDTDLSLHKYAASKIKTTLLTALLSWLLLP